MERGLKNYIEELKSDVASRVYSEGEGASFEDKFTEYCIEVLESIGKSEGARVLSYVHPNRQGGIDWKINGYCLKDLAKDENKREYYETLDLFITFYKNEYDYNITKDDYTKSLNQIKRFINSALKRQIDYIDKAHTELYHLIGTIGKQGKEFDRINVYFLINGFSNHEKEKIEIPDADVFVHTWDVLRLFKVNESNSIHEPIEIVFQNFSENGKGLHCLKVPNIDEMYDCYLAIVPGEILANLYKEFSNELLESNVRAFLGQAGKFNKGIRDTIRNKPQMFLPYNNGITATAESVETKIEDNKLVITKLNDFQIVNGGQTTASLYHTQKKFKDADLSKIFVQMKLTVIKDIELKSLEVPNIARFANSQNKVSELDLSSNNSFFISLENLSRKKYVINPDNKNQSILWFFERVNGQYRETLNKISPTQQRKFKEQCPLKNKFVKSDVAKFMNIWELKPHYVAQGSQKNFINFMKEINDSKMNQKLVDNNYYKKLIANAILFKSVDKLFGRKNIDAIGDTNLKGFTVAYSLSYFHFLTQNSLDLIKIYEEQKLTDLLILELKKILIFVYKHLLNEAKNSLISEYAKRSNSWNKLKEIKYDINLIDVLKDYMIDLKENGENINNTDSYNIEEYIKTINEIYSFGIKFWDGLRIYLSSNNSTNSNLTILNDLISKLNKKQNLTSKEINYGLKIIQKLKNKNKVILKISSFSNLQEIQKINFYNIYLELLKFLKDDWNQIIKINEQNSILEELETLNIISIRNSYIKKEKIKEQSLFNAYNSILKIVEFINSKK